MNKHIDAVHVIPHPKGIWSVRFNNRLKTFRTFEVEADAIEFTLWYAFMKKVPAVVLHDYSGMIYRVFKQEEVK